MRNSSLVECLCADNVPGLSILPKLRNCANNTVGRGAFHIGRRKIERTSGQYGSENAGVSNEKTGENPVRRKPKDSRGRFVLPGEVGA